jgi:hypothetical protein
MKEINSELAKNDNKISDNNNIPLDKIQTEVQTQNDKKIKNDIIQVKAGIKDISNEIIYFSINQEMK